MGLESPPVLSQSGESAPIVGLSVLSWQSVLAFLL